MRFTAAATIVIFSIIMEIAEAETHHRRHHHHSHNNSGEQRLAESSEEVNSEDETSTSTGVTPNNIEQRMAQLEQSVKYLCLEDEEDVNRQVRHLGIKCRCPTIEAPVCGSDNITYRNRCFLHCRAQNALVNYHRYRITLKKFGSC